MSENLRFILSQPYPSILITNTQRAGRESYERWMNANNRAISFMLVSMSDTLQIKMEKNEIATKILDALQEIFG